MNGRTHHWGYRTPAEYAAEAPTLMTTGIITWGSLELSWSRMQRLLYGRTSLGFT
jgi:hypothetical protein